MCENGDPIIHSIFVKIDTRARAITKTVGMLKVFNVPSGKDSLINFLSSELLLVIWSQKSQCHVGFAYPLQKSQCHVGFAYHPQKSKYRVSFAQPIIHRKCVKMEFQQFTQHV